MQLEAHIQAIQQDLAATAGLGDEATADAARRLSEALASTLHLRLLDLLGEAAAEIGSQLSSGRVEVRLAGRDPELVMVADEAPDTRPACRGGGAQGTHHAPAARDAQGRDRGGCRPRRHLHQYLARPHDRPLARVATVQARQAAPYAGLRPGLSPGPKGGPCFSHRSHSTTSLISIRAIVAAVRAPARREFASAGRR